jgi:phage gp36-like protein
MSYATQQDLVDRFGSRELIQLTDRSNVPPTTIDDTVVTRALGDADALIDSYIGKIYTLPLADVPAVLTKTAADIARYYLRGESVDKDSPVAIAFNQALSWLKDVSRGLVRLDDGGEEPDQAGGGAVRTRGPDRVFTRDTLRGL